MFSIEYGTQSVEQSERRHTANIGMIIKCWLGGVARASFQDGVPFGWSWFRRDDVTGLTNEERDILETWPPRSCAQSCFRCQGNGILFQSRWVSDANVVVYKYKRG